MQHNIALFLLSLVSCANCLPLNKREEVAHCANIYNECPEWKNAGFCEQNQDYMQATCPLTCGFCKEPEESKQAYTSQTQQSPGVSAYPQTPQAAQQAATVQANAQPQYSTNSNQTPQPQSGNVSEPKLQSNASQAQKVVNEKEPASQKNDKPQKEAIEEEGLTSDSDNEDSSSPSDEEPATNEQTRPSSKHIEKDNVLDEKADGEKEQHKQASVAKDTKEAASSGSGVVNEGEAALNELDRVYSRSDLLTGDVSARLGDAKGTFDTVESFNDDMRFSSVDSDEAQEDEELGSAEAADEGSSSGFDESSGVKKTEKGENEQDSEENTKNEENKKNKDEDKTNKAAEEERTENAEKYEDEEKQNEKGVKPVQQRSHEKKNLMETMLENGDLKAVSVSKAKTRARVPVHHHKEEEGDDDDQEDDVTDVDLDFKETGLEHFSGSGAEDDKMHLTLRQNFDKKYEDQTAPAFKILSGNFEKDMGTALGDETAVTDVSFSEAEVEGNPRTTGKVRVNFKFNGDYKKLQKLVSSGSVNGLLVVKNSLEGPMLNLEESE